MSSKVLCYLRTLRLGRDLTQEEVASLLPKGSRNRVGDVEKGFTPPNAEEILAYPLIFGLPVKDIFPQFYSEVEDAVMRGAYELHRRVEADTSRSAQRKRTLTEEMLARATGKDNRHRV